MNSILALIALAIAPGIYLSVVIYGKDKYDKEPKRILLAAFLLGAISIIPAGFIEQAGSRFFDLKNPGLPGFAVYSFILIAFTEELTKFLALRFHAYRRPEFNEPFDGIVYASFVALGFATAENIGYVLNEGVSTALVRMFTAVPAHYSFGVVMGYFVGKGKFATHGRTFYLFAGLICATLMHGAYDFFIIQKNYPALSIFTFVVLLMSWQISKRAIAALQADSVFRLK